MKFVCSAAGRFRRAAFLILAFLFLSGSAARAETPLERIRGRSKLVIATDASYPPFEYVEKEKFLGFDIDLGNALGKELGVETQWLNQEWSGVFPGLEARKFDLVMSGVTITPERKRGLGFTRPYFLSGQAVVRRRGDTRITGAKDLLDKVVAVQQETTGQTAAKNLKIPDDQIHRFDTLPDALLDLVNRKSDAAIGDLPAMQDLIRKNYGELEVAGGVFVEENLGIVARKDEGELIEALNAALSRIMADGRYARIYERWLGEPIPPDYLARLDRVKDQGTGRGEGSSSSAFTIRWDVLREALPYLLKGALLTIELTVLALLCGIPLGLGVSLARLGSFKPLSAVATVYVETVRGTPLLMQIYVIYFVLPAAGLNIPAFGAGVAALSLNAAAYIAEIFRSGIQSIDVGQMEAARSLGMTPSGAMRWVILPQTVRRVLPPLTNEAVALLKDSSLVSVVALTELMRVGKEIASRGSAMTVYLAVALFYLAMTLPLTHLVRWLEAKWQPVSRPRAKK